MGSLAVEVLKSLGAWEGKSRSVLWFDSGVSAAWALDAISSDLVVYDCSVRPRDARQFSDPVSFSESRLLQSAGLVVAGCQVLYQELKCERSDVHYVAAGIQERLLKGIRGSVDEPADVRTLPHPRIGWVGRWDEPIDMGLVARLADRRRDWSFVLASPMEAPARQPLPSNVTVLGGRAEHLAPRYVCSFDVGFAPYGPTEATCCSSADELLMFLAVEVPVVSSRIPEVELQLSEWVTFADSLQEWESGIERALDRSPSMPLVAASTRARSRSWATAASEISSLIEATIPTRAPQALVGWSWA